MLCCVLHCRRCWKNILFYDKASIDMKHRRKILAASSVHSSKFSFCYLCFRRRRRLCRRCCALYCQPQQVSLCECVERIACDSFTSRNIKHARSLCVCSVLPTAGESFNGKNGHGYSTLSWRRRDIGRRKSRCHHITLLRRLDVFIRTRIARCFNRTMSFSHHSNTNKNILPLESIHTTQIPNVYISYLKSSVAINVVANLMLSHAVMISNVFAAIHSAHWEKEKIEGEKTKHRSNVRTQHVCN